MMPAMEAREISPFVGVPTQEVLDWRPDLREEADRVRAQKRQGERPRPSTRLTDGSHVLSPALRAQLLDRVAALVDENLVGRSGMCAQFADLLCRALVYLDVPARTVVGTARYYVEGREIFCWQHAWVCSGGEVVDGNADALAERSVGRPVLHLPSYWGAVADLPCDRKLESVEGKSFPPDPEVERVWWPELRCWLDQVLKA